MVRYDMAARCRLGLHRTCTFKSREAHSPVGPRSTSFLMRRRGSMPVPRLLLVLLQDCACPCGAFLHLHSGVRSSVVLPTASPPLFQRPPSSLITRVAGTEPSGLLGCAQGTRMHGSRRHHQILREAHSGPKVARRRMWMTELGVPWHDWWRCTRAWHSCQDQDKTCMCLSRGQPVSSSCRRKYRERTSFTRQDFSAAVHARGTERSDRS